jgi:hypothetical protein
MPRLYNAPKGWQGGFCLYHLHPSGQPFNRRSGHFQKTSQIKINKLKGFGLKPIVDTYFYLQLKQEAIQKMHDLSQVSAYRYGM